MAWFPRRGSAPQPPLRQQGWGPSPPPSGNDQSQPNSHRLPANTPFNRSRLSRAEHPSVLPCTSAQLAPALLVWSPALAPFPGATRYWPSALPTLCQPYCAASRRRVPNQTIAYAHPLSRCQRPEIPKRLSYLVRFLITLPIAWLRQATARCNSTQRQSCRRLYTLKLCSDPQFPEVPLRSDFSASATVISHGMTARVCGTRRPLSAGPVCWTPSFPY